MGKEEKLALLRTKTQDSRLKIQVLCLWSCVLGLSVFLVYNHKELMQPASESGPFDSNRVAQIRIVMKENDWQLLKTNAMAKPYVRADFWFDGQPIKNVAIRTKGMSSLRSSQRNLRLPLKVDFNFFNAKQTFRGVKNLNLNNGFKDPTLIREVLGYELFEQMGLPTPRRAFADVWVNDTHLGLYTMVEKIDKTFLRRNFANPEGNLYKPETPAAMLNWTKEDLDRQIPAPTPDRVGGGNVLKTSQSEDQTNLDIRIGGTRLGDLVTVLQREGDFGSEMLPKDTAASSPRGPFAPDQVGGGFRGRGERLGGPVGQFPGEPSGQFPGEPNKPFPGGFRGRGGGPGGQRGQFPGVQGGRGEPGGRGGPGGMFGRGGNLIEQMALKTNTNSPDHSNLLHFLEVLNKSSDESFPSEIEKVLDVDKFLRFLAVSVLIVHLDNYIGMGHNYYLYEADGKFTVIPWDLNEAFGTFGMGVSGSTANFSIDEPVTGSFMERPLVSRILAHKPYLDKYHQYLEQLLKGGFAEGVIEGRIDELAKLVRPFVEADNLKFSSSEDFERSDSDNPASGVQAGFGRGGGRGGFGGGGPGGRGGGPGMNAPLLMSFIKERRLSVREQLNRD